MSTDKLHIGSFDGISVGFVHVKQTETLDRVHNTGGTTPGTKPKGCVGGVQNPNFLTKKASFEPNLPTKKRLLDFYQ